MLLFCCEHKGTKNWRLSQKFFVFKNVFLIKKAMQDISFDCINRDIIFSENDFQIADQSQVSTQNAGIILESRVSNLLQPIIGIGYNSQVLGGNVAQASAQLSRAVSQILADNALSASWISIPPPPNVQFDFSLSASYAD